MVAISAAYCFFASWQSIGQAGPQGAAFLPFRGCRFAPSEERQLRDGQGDEHLPIKPPSVPRTQRFAGKQ